MSVDQRQLQEWHWGPTTNAIWVLSAVCQLKVALVFNNQLTSNVCIQYQASQLSQFYQWSRKQFRFGGAHPEFDHRLGGWGGVGVGLEGQNVVASIFIQGPQVLCLIVGLAA